MKTFYSSWLWGLVPASLFIHFANLGGLSIYALDEAKNATAAIEMLETGDWILPTFNHEPRYDKPPLHYYAFMLAYQVFGTNPFAARFFPALLGFATTWIFYGFLRNQKRKATAFWTAFVLTCSPHWVIQFHMAVPDAFLVFFLSCALLGFYTYIRQDFNSKPIIRIAYIAMALAVLSKGPVALLIVSGIVLCYFLLAKGWQPKIFLKLLDPLGLLFLLGLILPWYILVALKTDGQWVTEFIFKHNIGRFSSAMEGHGGGPWKTLTFVVAGMLPFSPILFFRPSRFHTLLQPKNSFLLFSGLSVLVIVLLFMIAGTKLPNYTVPAYPFMAVLIASQIERILENEAFNCIQVFGWFGCLLVMVVCFAPYFIFQNETSLQPMLGATKPFLVLVTFTLPIFFYLLWQKYAVKLLLWTGICFFGITTTFFFFSMPVIERFNPVTTADLQAMKESEVFYFKNFNAAFSFYLQKRIQNIETSQNPPKTGYVITRESNLLEFDSLQIPYQLVHKRKDLFETPVTVVLKIIPLDQHR